jgi:hypothetical protein
MYHSEAKPTFHDATSCEVGTIDAELAQVIVTTIVSKNLFASRRVGTQTLGQIQ